MLLADSGILIIALLLIVGIGGFFFMAVALLARLLRFLFRSLTGSARADPRVGAPPRGGPVACSGQRCGHVNPPGAQFCARCGRPLGRHDDVDAYG